MQMSNGNGDGGEKGAYDPGAEFKAMMKEAMNQPKERSAAEKLGAMVGTLIGLLVTSFGMPFLIVFAYNGLQPAVWPDISYLPTVAALAVFRIFIHMIRKE